MTAQKDVKGVISQPQWMYQKFVVTNKRESLKLIPYVGCKSGFSHIFDSLVPDNYGKKIYDLFGGGGSVCVLCM